MDSASHLNGLHHGLKYVLKNNCEIFDLPPHFNAADTPDSEFRPAPPKFMATATPDPRVASDVLNHFFEHKDAMAVMPVSHFAPSSSQHSIEFTIDNVLEAVNPVRAKLAYIQVPRQDGEGTDLHLVCKVGRYIY
jgi:extracellular elastinolytic metalloproteinase